MGSDSHIQAIRDMFCQLMTLPDSPLMHNQLHNEFGTEIHAIGSSNLDASHLDDRLKLSCQAMINRYIFCQ